jgi:FtsZ-interacting cell division protein ZipA
MPELRIILLVAGVLFVAGIAGYEWWRSRGTRGFRATPLREESPGDAPAPRAPPLPDINVVRDQRVAMSDSLPVIELASTSASGTRRALGISISNEVAVDVAHDAAASPEGVSRHNEPYIQDELSEVRVFDEQPVRGPQLILSWAPEGQRRIVTLRVIPKVEPRFAGRSLRQAFASAGFWHGPLDIYHLPDRGGRVILSAAALAQPGTFDPSIMDSQRFSGLNLFAVLPGPLPERETFDELVHAARALADRLDGTLADQHGEELTAQRVARLRQGLEAPPQARAAGES